MTREQSLKEIIDMIEREAVAAERNRIKTRIEELSAYLTPSGHEFRAAVLAVIEEDE